MDKIKEAFHKIKQDIDDLKSEMFFLKEYLIEIKEEINNLSLKIEKQQYGENQTNRHKNQTNRHIIQTQNHGLEPLNNQISMISTGNEGVPTDRQTDRQTDTYTQIINKNIQNNQKNEEIQDILEILDSLDNVKKEIRLKFKRLTEKEFLVFSTIYQLEGAVDVNYKILSERLNLSESSIRDYVGKLIKKGIPVDKIKLNNKNIKLSISEDLKKIVSLPTILQLREI